MKVVHYSDYQDSNFINLSKQADILFTTGDLSYFHLNSTEFVQNKIPSFGVYGNHDDGHYLETLGITNVHNKVVDYKGIKIGGFQGCIKYKEGGIYYTEDQAKDFYINFPYVDILLLHAGPLDMLDDKSDATHTGSLYIKNYVIEKSPKFVFLGHQYSNAEMLFNATQLYRSFGSRLIDINF